MSQSSIFSSRMDVVVKFMLIEEDLSIIASQNICTNHQICVTEKHWIYERVFVKNNDGRSFVYLHSTRTITPLHVPFPPMVTYVQSTHFWQQQCWLPKLPQKPSYWRTLRIFVAYFSFLTIPQIFFEIF